MGSALLRLLRLRCGAELRELRAPRLAAAAGAREQRGAAGEREEGEHRAAPARARRCRAGRSRSTAHAGARRAAARAPRRCGRCRWRAVTMMPAAVEMISAGICETRPSPTVRIVYVDAAVATSMPRCTTPMKMPPRMLTIDDEDAEDRVALHELGRTVHGAVEVGGARDLLAARARLLLVDQAGREVGVDGHLLAGHRVEREARGHLGDAAGTLRDDDEVDADQDQEDHDADGVVAADHELAERLDDLARLARGEDEARARDVEPEAEEREQQQQRREGAEVERVGVVERDEQHHEREADAGGQAEVEQDRRQRQHDQRDDEHHGERERDFGASASGGGLHGQGEGGAGHGQAAAVPRQRLPWRWRCRSTKASTSATAR